MHHHHRSPPSAVCTPYCDANGQYVSSHTCISANNNTVYCCGTQTHKFCCYDSKLDISTHPGVMYCEEKRLSIGFIGPWIPVFLMLIVAYPLMKCSSKKFWRNRTSTNGEDAENGEGDDAEESSAPPSPAPPPSYDDATAKPPPYDQACGMINLGFSMEDIEHGADVLRVHNSCAHNSSAGEGISSSLSPSTSYSPVPGTSSSLSPCPNMLTVTLPPIGKDETRVRIENTVGESTTDADAVHLVPEVGLSETVPIGDPPPAYAEIPCARI